MGAADIDVVGLNVHDMGSLETVFDVVGAGSTAMVESLVIENNDLGNSNPPIRWTAVTVRDGGAATFVGTTVSNCTNIRHVFSASLSSRLDIIRAQVTGLMGGRAIVSAI